MPTKLQRALTWLTSAGRTSATQARADIGLGSVANTSDLAKPISTATQTALDAKAPADLSGEAQQAVLALKANAGTLSSAITNALNVACWGDSLTAGTGGTPYPAQLSTLSGYATFNGGVGGNTSSQVKTRFDADTARRGYNVVFWVGRNDFGSGFDAAWRTQVKADLAAMVAALGHSRYMVLSILNQNTAITGTAEHTGIVTLNAELSTIHGSRYFDIRGYLINSALDALGISPSAQDLLDIGNDVPPDSLRSDNIHLNTNGYLAVATAVNSLVSIFQTSDTAALSPANILSLFRSPPALGTSARAPGNFSALAVGAATSAQSGVNGIVNGSWEIKNGQLILTNTAGTAVRSIYLSGDGSSFQHDADILPSANGTRSLGGTSLRYAVIWGNVIAVTTRVGIGTTNDWAGAGSPEGVVTSAVGSTYRRTDGGAGTAFYVKESGSGNTGWVAK